VPLFLGADVASSTLFRLYRKDIQNSLENLLAKEEEELRKAVRSSTEEQAVMKDELIKKVGEGKDEKKEAEVRDKKEEKMSRVMKTRRRRARLPRKSYGADYSPPPGSR
jgi:hypothetical protein